MISPLVLDQVKQEARNHQEAGCRRHTQAQFHLHKLEKASTPGEAFVQSFFARIDQDNSAKHYAMARSRLAHLESLEREHFRSQGKETK